MCFHINVLFSPLVTTNAYEGIFFSEKLCSGTKVFNASLLVHGKFSLTPHQGGPPLAKVKYVLGFHCCKAQVRCMDSGNRREANGTLESTAC